MCLPHDPTCSHSLAATVPPRNSGCLISSRALTSTGSCQQELIKKNPNQPLSFCFLPQLLKFPPAASKRITRLRCTSPAVTLLSPHGSARAGRESASIQLARAEVSSRDHFVLVQWYFYCNMFVYPLASWAPAWEAPSQGCGGVLHDPMPQIRPRAQSCAQAAKFSTPHPAPASL